MPRSTCSRLAPGTGWPLIWIVTFSAPSSEIVPDGEVEDANLQIGLTDARKVEPDFEGDYALVDAETGATVDVTMDASAVEAYVMRFAGLVEELRAWSKKHGASYLRVTTDEPLEGVVRRFVGRTID